MKPQLRVIDGRSSNYVTVPAYQVEETHVELLVSRDDRIAHVSNMRHYARLAMRALADGRYAVAGMWLVELDRLNEQETLRARAVEVAAKPCPDCEDCVRVPGHGAAA